MFEEIWKNFLWLIGGGGEEYSKLSVAQIIFRTVVIYGVALALIRVGKRRFMGSYTAFDILLGFVVGSILSRAITGSIQFLDTIVVISTLILLHWLIATISFYFDVGGIVKNTARELIVDGEIQEEAMRKSKIGENDLMQALHDKAGVESPEQVKAAYLERDGNITVIPKPEKPRIIEIKVEEGVQTVKVVIEG